MSVKNELAKLEKAALIEILSDLYKKNKPVQEYLDFISNLMKTGYLKNTGLKFMKHFTRNVALVTT